MSYEYPDPELTEQEITELIPDDSVSPAGLVGEDSEPPESVHDKVLRWLDELVLNVKLTDDQVIEVAKVYALQDMTAVVRRNWG